MNTNSRGKNDWLINILFLFLSKYIGTESAECVYENDSQISMKCKNEPLDKTCKIFVAGSGWDKWIYKQTIYWKIAKHTQKEMHISIPFMVFLWYSFMLGKTDT